MVHSDMLMMALDYVDMDMIMVTFMIQIMNEFMFMIMFMSMIMTNQGTKS